MGTAWWVGGFVVAVLLLWLGGRRIDEREIPRIGVVTAVFFAASQIHLPTLAGSVHLVLNGLAGVLLRGRAVVAIGVGLFLQSLLFEHGGRSTLGVNCVVIALPALAAGFAFPRLRRSQLLHTPWVRSGFVLVLVGIWLALCVDATQIVIDRVRGDGIIKELAHSWLTDATILLAIGIVAAVVAVAERRLESDPDFALGLLLGSSTVAASVVLKMTVLWLGGEGDWRALASGELVVHTPVIVVEGVGVGFAVRVLSRSKPEWLTEANHGK